MSHEIDALVHRRRPVEDLDRRRDRDEEAEEREDQRRVDRLAGDEHVVAPHQEAEHRDAEAGEGDEACSRRSACAQKRGDQLADHAHRRQDHDVDGRVRVEPEQVLEQHRVAAAAPGSKMPNVEQPLDRHQQDA